MRRLKTNPASELLLLARMKDDLIDTTDIPPISDWSNAITGKFYRPNQTPLTIQLDADVFEWLKVAHSDYQTTINELLRAAMEGDSRHS